MTGLDGGVLAASAAESPLVIAAIGLIGSLIGGGIAATVSLVIAKQARDEARAEWIRNNRRDIYDRFLTSAQELLIACVHYRELPPKEAESAIKEADLKLFSAHVVVQTVADRGVAGAARIHAYRLMRLEQLTLDALGSNIAPRNHSKIAPLSRESRHATIEAIREELGLTDGIDLASGFDPFSGTELEGQYPVRPYARQPQPQRGPG
jgi:hypothetical protein